MILSLTLILTLAGAIALYVIYPRRGLDVPHAPWVGDALERGVAKLPTLENSDR